MRPVVMVPDGTELRTFCVGNVISRYTLYQTAFDFEIHYGDRHQGPSVLVT